MALGRRVAVCAVLGCAAVALARAPLRAQVTANVDPSLFRELQWRHIGPFQGGRTTAGAGVPSQPGVFYIGAANGGAWKTNDFGRTWRPIFDDQPVSAIGAIAIAPSNPNVLYIGTGWSGPAIVSGDAAIGDGLYKSIDAGRTWTHLGLRDSQQIARIAVDPSDPNRLFVAALGHPYAANDERGIFRSTDGGQTFSKVLFQDADTGGADVALDPANPNTVYASLWRTRLAPWERGSFSGQGSGLFKSSDGGSTWQPLTTRRGFPTFTADTIGRIGIALAPTKTQRIFARTRAGLYRSDDAGSSWELVDGSGIADGPDIPDVAVDPRNPDIVYAVRDGVWRSNDGGRTFAIWRRDLDGGGHRRIWIDSADPSTVLLAGDRGAIVTVNGGETWSSRENQPTAHFARVSTDNAFPYRVCGAQSSHGSLCVASRGNDGRITARDWSTIGPAGGPVLPDPADPDIVYVGLLNRFDRRTRQLQTVTPPIDESAQRRTIGPIAFSPLDSRALYFGAAAVWKTMTAGQAWTAISPDLTRETWDVPPTVGTFREILDAAPTSRGTISTLAVSSIDANLIWAGTDDGLVHVTRDGGRGWTNVTPAHLAPWASVLVLEPSHFDVNTAYAAVNASRLDSRAPALFRTRDGGRSWSLITGGLASNAPVNSVREDRLRRGLLFAASDRSVSVSFDDGDHWQALQLNMPATPISDLAVKDEDLVAATDGRGFWILDDITPLRQITADIARAEAFLFRPATAWRWRANARFAASAGVDEPAAANPPDGVMLSYFLGPNATGQVTLEILEGTTGTLIRRFSSGDASSRLVTTPGLHRIVWDVRFSPPMTAEPIAGMWVLPGTYQVRLTAGTRVFRQAVVVRTDPRVRTPIADLTEQFALSKTLNHALTAVGTAQRASGAGSGESGPSGTLASVSQALADVFTAIQQADAKPTAGMQAAAARALEDAEAALARYRNGAMRQ